MNRRIFKLQIAEAWDDNTPLPLGNVKFVSIATSFKNSMAALQDLVKNTNATIHMIVRVQDQKRDGQTDEHKQLPAWIPDDEFDALFGQNPVIHAHADGCEYYISKPIDGEKLGEHMGKSFCQVFETSYLVVFDNSLAAISQETGLVAPYFGEHFILDPFLQFVQSVLLKHQEISS